MRAFLMGAVLATAVPTMASAQTTVVTFDDIATRGGVVAMPTNYGGISWDSAQFGVYGAPQDPWNPASTPNRALTNREGGSSTPEPISFSFASDVSFGGMAFSGPSYAGPMSYSVLLNGASMATMTFNLSSTATFIASTYTGAADQVTITGTRGQYVFDNVTYSGLAATSAVPEPASWAMMIGGFGIIGGTMRRQRKVKTTVRFA